MYVCVCLCIYMYVCVRMCVFSLVFSMEEILLDNAELFVNMRFCIYSYV